MIRWSLVQFWVEVISMWTSAVTSTLPSLLVDNMWNNRLHSLVANFGHWPRYYADVADVDADPNLTLTVPIHPHIHPHIISSYAIFFLHFYVRHLHRHIRILPSVTHSNLYNISGCCVLRSVRDSETWVLKDLPNRKTTGVTNSPLVVMLVIDAQILVLHITKLLCKMWQVIDRLQVSD